MAKKCLGLVVARGGSKGIPGKNLRKLAGKPLISHTFCSAKGSELLDKVVLSTDSEEIAATGRQEGVEVPFIRPPELATDEAPTLPVIEHALDWLIENSGYVPDVVVLLQPTAPLRQSRHIDEAVGCLLSSDADSIVSVCEVPGHYNPHWQFRLEGGFIQVFTGEALHDIVTRRQNLPQTYTRNGAVYAIHTEALMRTGTLFGDSCLAYIMPPEVSVNIDALEDLERAEALLAGGSGSSTGPTGGDR